MTREEQLQIVEDNLNEYGQCNITLEEYNFLKDELYSSGCLAGIELGRAEVIEEILEMDKYECTEELCHMMNSELSCASCYAYKLLDKLKEQNK